MTDPQTTFLAIFIADIIKYSLLSLCFVSAYFLGVRNRTKSRVIGVGVWGFIFPIILPFWWGVVAYKERREKLR